jgi:hypothetical protein
VSFWSCGDRHRLADCQASNERLVRAQGGREFGCKAVEVESSRVAPPVTKNAGVPETLLASALRTSRATRPS